MGDTFSHSLQHLLRRAKFFRRHLQPSVVVHYVMIMLRSLFLLVGCCFYLALGEDVIDTSSEYVHPDVDEPYTEAEAAASLLDPSHVGDLIESLKLPFKDDVVCKSDADIGFILDSSRSIWNHYDQEKNFLTSLVKAFGLGEEIDRKSRASVITFSYYTEMTIRFDDYFDFDLFKAAVDKIPLMSSVTFMDRALRQAQREMFTAFNGARPNMPKVLVLLTDGEQSPQWPPYEDPAMIVKELRQAGINVLVVGMGGGVKESSIINIVGSKEKAFKVKQFDKLVSPAFINQMQTKVCEAATEKCPDNDIDYNGADIKLVTDITSWQNCAGTCSTVANCQVFTYVTKKKCCYLKSGDGYTKTPKTGVISGSKRCALKA